MKDLLLAPAVRAQLESLQKNPPHALLLVGPTGFGKRAIATAWASALATPEIVEPDEKGTIAIETIRQLYRQTRSRQAGRQVVVVDQAQAMGIEAQNAFLKLLEEPRAGVTFVLTTPTPESLLPTIASRMQVVLLQPLPAATLQTWATSQGALPGDLVQFLFIAQGRPGVLAQLLQSPERATSDRKLMQKAKVLLAADTYERLAQVGELAKDRAQLVVTLEAMATMVKVQLAKDPQDKWLRLADALETCLSRLAQNGNPRAQLTHFFLSY